MKLLVNLYLLTFLLISTSASAVESYSTKGWENAYSRRVFQLGMTLTDFRNMKFPEDISLSDTKHIPADKVFVQCEQNDLTDYAALDLQSDYGDEKTDVLKCAHYYPAYGSHSRAMLKMGDNWRFHTIFYFIKPEGAEDFLLFKITSETMAAGYYELVQLLSAGLNKKPVIKLTTVQNGFGAQYANHTATWDNGVSRIQIEEYDYSLEEGKLTYLLKSLEKIHTDRQRHSRSPRPDSL